MTEMFGEAWSPMSVPDLAPDDDDKKLLQVLGQKLIKITLILLLKYIPMKVALSSFIK